MAFGYTLVALDFLWHPPVEIVIAGDLEGSMAAEFLATVHGRFLPAKVLAGNPSPGPAGLEQTLPLLADKRSLDGKTLAYVCQDCTCQEPVEDAEKLATLL